MQKYSLNGQWNMQGGGYNCNGNIPGSVYSFLLDNKLMEDPYYRTNELAATDILENDFDFSRKFNFAKPDYPVLLHCDGLDTLCDIYINNKHIAHTDNMHRTYEFDVTDIIVDGENEIKLSLLHQINSHVKCTLKTLYPVQPIHFKVFRTCARHLV